MKLKSEVIGGGVTAIYLVGVAFLVYLKRDSLHTLELNAIGDFLAGVFGPVAFLWLVLGYMQQGRELKLSSEALQLQAMELKNSVDQQVKMVETQHLSLENHERSLEPILSLKWDGLVTDESDGCDYDSFSLNNNGGYCEDVHVNEIVSVGNKNLANFDQVERGSSKGFLILQDDEINVALEINYKKISGKKNSQFFELRKVFSDGDYAFIIKRRPFQGEA
ncbi:MULTISPECIES: hypothetical protein [Pseudomonas]|uniref:hypothetical protein n=1 Tax=Pseudomonas TaxID=286 RepID=UPI0028E140F6|nr:hypothetical protein [Pseudomonas sp. JV245A]MDT9641295.1 hypothetical protein [Pseudomonas sp. JV245A]